MAAIRIQLDLTLPGPPVRVLLAAALLALCAGELASENVTLSTYYPAPSGVYSKMIVTESAYLARDTGAAVAGPIPGSIPAGTKLYVNGNTYMAGAASVNAADLTVNTGNALINSGSLTVTGGNIVAAGSGGSNGYVHVDNASTGCVATTVVGNAAACAGNQYATWMPGFWVDGWTYQDRGGPVMANYGAGNTAQVWGLNTVSGAASWMTLNFSDSSATFYCCPK